MSCGQRSQVVLGVILAQNPDLLILDDYSMGLDAGYRRLFLEVLHDFHSQGNKTIFVTSHIVQDLEQLVDTIILINDGKIIQTNLSVFMSQFRKFQFQDILDRQLAEDDVIKGIARRGRITLVCRLRSRYPRFCAPPSLQVGNLDRPGGLSAGRCNRLCRSSFSFSVER